jgi:hypothetical protein
MGSTPFFLRCEYSIRAESAPNDDGHIFHCFCYQTGTMVTHVQPFATFAESADKVFSLLQDMCVSSVDLEILFKSKLYVAGNDLEEQTFRLTTKELEGNVGTVFVVENEEGKEAFSHISVVTCLQQATEKLFNRFSQLGERPEGTLLEILLESCGTGVRPDF